MSVIGHSPLAGASGVAGGSDPLYVDDVFSTFVYEGSGSSRSIDNGIDLSGEGGLVWIKERTVTQNHMLIDTVRGAEKFLVSNSTQREFNDSSSLTAFNNDGFTLSNGNEVNQGSQDFVSWTFRKAPGFFDVVTYSGTGSVQNISHSLGSVPGMILIKMTSDSDSWIVYHRALGATHFGYLNNTSQFYDNDSRFNDTEPTASVFTVGTDNGVNQSGKTFVAYLFAHDDQSFGTNSDESIIKCGSYTGNESLDGPEINLGFEPQWLMYKKASAANGNWEIIDMMRGMPSATSGASNQSKILVPNTSAAESTDQSAHATSTGFKVTNNGGSNNGSGVTYIYMAIRRPHKPPTAGTEVFTTKLWTGNAVSTRTITGVGFTPDLVFGDHRGSAYGVTYYDRLRGKGESLVSSSTGAEGYTRNEGGLGQDSFDVDASYGLWNNSGMSYVGWVIRRAPGFFDVVTYTGTGSTLNINHNLGSVPEMIVVKNRETTFSWTVYHSSVGATKRVRLNASVLAQTSSGSWNDTAPTSSVFTVGNDANTNYSGLNSIAYLFATLDGISKVGSYTGTGSDVNVDCGFTAGARFILIKRTDNTGDWYVWDTTRGIVSGNDPYLLLNSTAAEVTNTDYIDPLNAGFTVTSSAPAALNASGGTYLFLAIA